MSKMADDLLAEQNKVDSCKLCLILETMAADDAVTIREALLGGVPLEIVSRVLGKNGYPISGISIKRHISKGHE